MIGRITAHVLGSVYKGFLCFSMSK